jgi:hypothetical protein
LSSGEVIGDPHMVIFSILHKSTELSTEADAQQFSIHDILINQGDYPKEYEALYHSNFGPPLLDPGASFSAPVQQVSPFNERAVPEVKEYQT